MIALRTDSGDDLPLDPDRWHSEPTPLEHHLLAAAEPPVLDIGCGPGRLVAALASLGVPALGIEPLAEPAAMARGRGASVLQRSVFDRLPGQGRWSTVLLIDGNVGIGGEPVRLLDRCRSLAAPDGRIIVEVESPGRPTATYRARLESDDAAGPWFAWSIVGVDDIDGIAAAAGLDVVTVWSSHAERRWFAALGSVAIGARGAA